MQLPGVAGVTLYRIRTDQFPFSRTMSQERTELAPGAVRPVVWTTADSFFMVISGTVTVNLEGGILGKEAHLAFNNETLKAWPGCPSHDNPTSHRINEVTCLSLGAGFKPRSRKRMLMRTTLHWSECQCQ